MAHAIGTLSQATGNVTAVNEAGQERTLQSGDAIYEGDVISVSGNNAQAKVTFNNGCNMTLHEGESALIDETAYKLEFYDNAEVAIDLESAQGISQEIAALDSDTPQAEIENFEDLTNIEDLDLSDLDETAAGPSNNSSSQITDDEVQERLDTHEDDRGTNVINDNVNNSVEGGLNVTQIDRGGELTDDTTAPILPTVTTTIETNNGFTNDNTLDLSGEGEADTTIIIYDSVVEADSTNENVGVLGEVTVDGNGVWNFSSDPLNDGIHTISIESVDSAGNSTLNEDVATFIVDTVAPDIPNVLVPSLTNDVDPMISGYAQEGETITITVGDDSFTATANDQGYWEVQLDSLSDGAYDLLVSSTDTAGNTSPVSTNSMTIDTTAPDAPQVSLVTLSNDGLLVSGEAEAQSTINVTIGDAVQTAAADENGSWSVSFEELSSGTHTISVTAVDSVGNVSSTALASVLIDTNSVTYEITSNSSEGEVLGLEAVTLYSVGSDSEFDPNATTLDLALVEEGGISEHDKGLGVEGGSAESRAISGDEAFIIALEGSSENIRIDVDKLQSHENASWSVYDENMQLVGSGTFSGDELIDAQGQSGSLYIGADDVDGAFNYIVLTAVDADNGRDSSFFLEDISYSSDGGGAYSYTVDLENIVLDDTYEAQLLIDGLSEDIHLEDAQGNAIGTFDEGQWVLSGSELETLSSEDEVQIQIVSTTELDLSVQDYEITLVQSDYDQDAGIESTLVAQDSLSFDILPDLVTLTLGEERFDDESLNLENLLQLSNGNNQLEIVSSEDDHQTLTLDANSWEIKTDTNGESINILGDEGNAIVYTSVDTDIGFDLIIDEMITVILES